MPNFLRAKQYRFSRIHSRGLEGSHDEDTPTPRHALDRLIAAASMFVGLVVGVGAAMLGYGRDGLGYVIGVLAALCWILPFQLATRARRRR